jgi:hypothetical protein
MSIEIHGQKIESARNGGFMIKKTAFFDKNAVSGKIAFPDTKYKIPAEVKAGETWDVELFHKPHLKVDFFRFIEKSEDRIKRKREAETQKAFSRLEELKKFGKMGEDALTSLLRNFSNDGYLYEQSVDYHIERLRRFQKKVDRQDQLLERFKELIEIEPEYFVSPMEPYKNIEVSIKFIEERVHYVSWEGDCMRSGDNTRGAKVIRYYYEPLEKLKDLPEGYKPDQGVELDYKKLETTVPIDWFYPELRKAENEYFPKIRPYKTWEHRKKAIELIKKNEYGIYVFPIISSDGFPSELELGEFDENCPPDIDYFQLSTWEEVYEANNY